MILNKKFFLIVFLTISLNAKDRIITLSPAINEIIYALGIGNQVVGNTQYCLFPKETLSVPKVGGYFSTSLEKILALNPTIVIMQKNNHKLQLQLNRLHIKTKMIQIDTLDNIKKSILELGNLFKQKKSAQKIVKSINNSLEAIKNIVSNKRILIVFGHNISLSKNIFVAGQNLYFNQIIIESGNINALQSKRKGQPILNMENIIATNPDIVILLAHSIEKRGLTRKQLIDPWLKLPINASKTGSIYIENKIYAGIPSDRIVLFLNDFKEILKDYKKR
ncbi:Vitamin B12 ABC transporter, B12-binding component BtuF [hydrothermal vent metagenome]|uniref:Vitamin B12 ABC transporter, B12-binding component BtuF n=1 Tax=hydrothermal vent metagenome TaxID=652676 RepID=A0A1W1CII1_9ZZZZ